ncbi:hypothetical protein NFI96_027208, partial [Prochilodus magdalenae]
MVFMRFQINSSSTDTLSLPLDIQQPDNDPYSCVASNPVSTQTTTVNITQHCPHTAGVVGAPVSRIFILPVILTCAAVSVIGMCVFLWRKKSTCGSEKEHNDPDLLTAEISISVSVSRTSAQTVLNGAVGESVTFPTRVPVSGSISYRGRNIGVVLDNQAKSFRDFKNHLHWSSQSGFFSLSDLRTDDSGLYTVDDTEESRKEDYELNVYGKFMVQSEIKLQSLITWSYMIFMRFQIKHQHLSCSSSTDDTLSLPLDIQQPDNDSYSCVASNPVSKQTTTLNITQHCPHTAVVVGAPVSRIFILPVILTACAAVSVIGMGVFLWRKKSTCQSEKEHNDPDLLTAEISISVSVSRTSAQTVLNGAVGESITFPTRVPVTGSISDRGGNIGVVFKKQEESYREFKNRLHWNSQSGFFSLSDLRTADSGRYTVDNVEEGRKEDYELNVYDKVSAPQLIQLISSPPESELCSVLCSVRNVRGLNLSWFKGGVLLNHTSSSSTNDTLSLPLDIQRSDIDPYSCVASNPVSKQTTTVDITQQCFYYPVLGGSAVKVVSNYRYLGVHLSNNFTWSNNTSSLVRKAHQRLYFLRRLRRAGLGSSVLTSFYRCVVESVLCCSINVWHGSCSAADRKALQMVVKAAQRSVGVSLPTTTDIYTT